MTDLSMTDFASTWWGLIVGGFSLVPAPAIGALQLAAILGSAVALSLPAASWRYFGLFVTTVHELGHAVAALVSLQRVSGIELRFNHSGVTMTRGRGGWRAVWTAFWGYPVPALVGVALVGAAVSGAASVALSLGALVLLALVFLIRNLQGFVVAGLLVGLSTALVWYAGPQLTGYAALSTGVALLVGAVKDWFKVTRVHLRSRAELASSDAYLLAQRSGVPAVVWLGLFACVIGACLAGAAGFLYSAVSLSP
ncbi:M50 family metallopeptidase [Arthrobacter sp. Br18]|uniref:M50 family metallopeptidase n=1 Tax=Arthrobacter sp. Br18 TaxID=1312954 RepID=UPI0004B198BB|nr:M50 family metallopeptidase [Arthrobacter sp. Br18]